MTLIAVVQTVETHAASANLKAISLRRSDPCGLAVQYGKRYSVVVKSTILDTKSCAVTVSDTRVTSFRVLPAFLCVLPPPAVFARRRDKSCQAFTMATTHT